MFFKVGVGLFRRYLWLYDFDLKRVFGFLQGFTRYTRFLKLCLKIYKTIFCKVEFGNFRGNRHMFLMKIIYISFYNIEIVVHY